MNVDLDSELTRLGIARISELALEGAAETIGALTPAGTATNLQAALGDLHLALENATQEQQQALEALTTRFDEYCTATNRALAEIHEAMAAGS
ncbi:hypothetical protein D3C75_1126380 [compost metagenome]